MDTQITTKFKIGKPTNKVFEAIVNPEKIGNFWFSSSSERWEQGRTLTLRYNEYDAEVVIHVLEVEENRKIEYSWGGNAQETVVTIILKELDNTSSIIEVNESGLKEDVPEIIKKMIGQKEGWVYTLTCLKGYLESGVTNLRASLIF
ncbi:SRPBCC family protein [Peribacillus sp. CSMR9]|uniref:SRPBCC family protein n=1 Tax=Peribacillus sp. CSMR9 TaxID=2981350 RepID=UPI00295489E1|nr:SRPBCC family protein [Peribacillus sp. CSMR9]MDV7766204.1 SRPBCC family protein [Peribacillus sp. CSMR9]